MKALLIWLGTAVVVLGGVVLGYHLFRERNPDQVLVVVDSSFAMHDAWDGVRARLDDIDDRRYAEFALITEKRRVHGWSSSLDLDGVEPYAPRDFSELENRAAYSEIEDASEIIFITNADAAETAVFDGWKIVAPES
jgi:hypothetical protein